MPLAVCPVAPAGEQNAPGCTTPASGWEAGFGAEDAGFGEGFGAVGAEATDEHDVRHPRRRRGIAGQPARMRCIAAFSAGVTQSPYGLLHADLVGDVGAPEGLVRRQPGGGVAVALLLVRRPVDGEEVDRVVGEVDPLRLRQPLRTGLPGVAEGDDVVDLHGGARAGAADEVDRIPGVRIVQHAGEDAASACRSCRRGRGAGCRRGCRSRCGPRPARRRRNPRSAA